MTNPSKKKEIGVELLREFLSYNPDTGEIMWIKKPSLAIPAGAKAGYLSPVGYFIVSFKGVSHLLHRLAWVLYTGEWPDGFIDHIDKDKLNNKISNLRVSSREQNGRNSNSRKNSSSKYLGVVGARPLKNGSCKQNLWVKTNI